MGFPATLASASEALIKIVFREIETVFGLVRIPVLFVPNTRS